jgi:hypothetical protein
MVVADFPRGQPLMVDESIVARRIGPMPRSQIVREALLSVLIPPCWGDAAAQSFIQAGSAQPRALPA